MVSYKRTKTGLYDAEYNFSAEDDGETDPTDWVNGDTGAGSSSIINNHLNHNKVIEQSDTDAADGNYALLTHTVTAAKDEGIVEYQRLMETWDQKGDCIVALESAADTCICAVFINGEGSVFSYNSDTDNTVTAYGVEGNITIHIAICFNNTGGAKDVGDGGGNLDSGKFRVYINSVAEADEAMVNVADVKKVLIKSFEEAPV